VDDTCGFGHDHFGGRREKRPKVTAERACCFGHARSGTGVANDRFFLFDAGSVGKSEVGKYAFQCGPVVEGFLSQCLKSYCEKEEFLMRVTVPIAVLAILGTSTIPIRAASIEDQSFDLQTIKALEAKVEQAQPRERCFLYAELVHQMTEVSLRQYAAGDAEKASGLLRQVQKFSRKFHLSLTENDKRLKNAEILLRRTAFRLTEMLHSSSFEDRALVEQTLVEVNQAQSEAMMQVFRK
jgi:hypothetical protein